MAKPYKLAFWIILTGLLFTFFRWFFSITIADAALEFASGTTFVIVTGLIAGYTLTKLALRMNAIKNKRRTMIAMTAFILICFVAIAFLLNIMVEKTTLFPFALTVLLLFLVMATVSGLTTVIRHQYKSRIQSAQAAMAHSQSELQLLQSRLSPHFLFNTLNNLYGLSITDADRVPALLLKLSDLLRYSVYDVKEMFVPLQHEIDYIQNYIAFERLRLGERLSLHIDIDPAFDQTYKIPPLMLIVFVENAFKHSRTAGEGMINIDLKLHTKDSRLVFQMSNSCNDIQEVKNHPEKRSGFGLDSVRRRLELLYADRHTLRIDKTANQYIAHLELEY